MTAPRRLSRGLHPQTGQTSLSASTWFLHPGHFRSVMIHLRARAVAGRQSYQRNTPTGIADAPITALLGSPTPATRHHGICYTKDMPIHDWSRVSAGTFHAFHHAWIAELQRALNAGLLPPDYYALAEQVAGDVVPDVLTLQAADDNAPEAARTASGGIAVAEAPPRVSLHAEANEATVYARRQKQLVIHHASDDRIVALIEIVSPGNKHQRAAIDAFVDKAVSALNAGYHLLVLDLLPPGPLAPQGMHGAVWTEFGGTYESPSGKPLTLAAYVSAAPFLGSTECYVEPTAVGTPLIDMPLFLDPGHYVNVPLESTYLAAYEGVPRRWKSVIEARA